MDWRTPAARRTSNAVSALVTDRPLYLEKTGCGSPSDQSRQPSGWMPTCAAIVPAGLDGLGAFDLLFFLKLRYQGY